MSEQKTVTDAKVQISMKEREIVDLKNKMEEQCRKALNEKEALINRLEELNIELKDRETIKELHKDKLQVISHMIMSDKYENEKKVRIIHEFLDALNGFDFFRNPLLSQLRLHHRKKCLKCWKK